MKRREFLKSTFFVAAISTVLGKATGVLTNAYAAGAFVAKGKLGYIEASNKPGKICSGCAHFKANPAAGAGAGECTLPVMKNMVKPATEAYVKDGAYCNMWKAKA